MNFRLPRKYSSDLSYIALKRHAAEEEQEEEQEPDGHT